LLTKLKSLSQKGKDAKLFLMITIQIIIKFNELVDENLTNCLSKNASLGIVLNAPNQVFDVRKWQLQDFFTCNRCWKICWNYFLSELLHSPLAR